MIIKKNENKNILLENISISKTKLSQKKKFLNIS